MRARKNPLENVQRVDLINLRRNYFFVATIFVALNLPSTTLPVTWAATLEPGLQMVP
jgi:hypothetical protein